MRKKIFVLLACSAFVAFCAQGATVTNFVTELVPASALQALLAEQLGDMVTAINDLHTGADFSGDLTLANGEKIDNDTDAAVAIQFDDPTATLGNLIVESSKATTTNADVFYMKFVAHDLVPEDTTLGTMVATIVDNSTNSFDSSLAFKAMVANTDTTILTLDASGATIVGTAAATRHSAATAGFGAAAAGTLTATTSVSAATGAFSGAVGIGGAASVSSLVVTTSVSAASVTLTGAAGAVATNSVTVSIPIAVNGTNYWIDAVLPNS